MTALTVFTHGAISVLNVGSLPLWAWRQLVSDFEDHQRAIQEANRGR